MTHLRSAELRRAGSAISGYFQILSHYYFGDDRLRQRDFGAEDFLFGMATVPVTHLLHTIDANSSILSKARDIVGKLTLPSFEPAFA